MATGVAAEREADAKPTVDNCLTCPTPRLLRLPLQLRRTRHRKENQPDPPRAFDSLLIARGGSAPLVRWSRVLCVR